MEDPEQLQQLKRSVAEWNQWRRQHPDLGPDLSDANLSRANLSGADLSWTDLSESNLSRANLQKADLSHTDLRGIPWLVIMGSYHFSVPRGILGLSQPNCDSRMIHLKRCNHDGCIKQKGAHAPVGKR